MSKREKFTFEKVFRITNRALWINGSHPGLPRDKKWVLKSFVTLSLSSSMLCLLPNSIIGYRVPNSEYTDVVRETIIAILAFTLVCKYTIVVYNRSVVMNLINSINDDFQKSSHFSAMEIKIISKYIKRGTKTTNIWILLTVLTGLVFATKGIFFTIYYHCNGKNIYVQIFDMVLPTPALERLKNELSGYIIYSCYLCLFDVCSIFVYIGYEPLICIFLLHSCGQLEILSLRMRNLFTQSRSSEEIIDEIKAVNSKLQFVYKFVEDVQKTFIPLFEFNMKTTTVALPFIVFQVVQSFRHHDINVEFLALFFCAFVQFYLPCFYSDYLMEKSEQLRLSIYSCGWEKDPNPRVRRMVLFMLTRTTKPVVLHTFFYLLCLDTFAEMCRQAYAIYNIMVATWA